MMSENRIIHCMIEELNDWGTTARDLQKLKEHITETTTFYSKKHKEQQKLSGGEKTT